MTTNTTALPKHIAIIMDGNGRWAKQKYLPRMAGHHEGLKAVRRIIQACGEQGISVLTLFAFSSENWRRPQPEVNGLMKLFLSSLQNEVEKLHNNNVRLRIVGDSSRLSEELKASIHKAQQQTRENTGLTLVIAVDYGGQWDILQATKKIAEQIENKTLSSKDITPQVFESFLGLADLPHPDLFIRTSGEKRISNFLLWQLAYTELYFTDIFWPDFDKDTLAEALNFYSKRERRFGCTSEQIAK
jgi:undecaprenyl diphosphate synthase